MSNLQWWMEESMKKEAEKTDEGQDEQLEKGKEMKKRGRRERLWNRWLKNGQI